MPENWRLNAINNQNKKLYDEGYERIFSNKKAKPPKNNKRGKKISP